MFTVACEVCDLAAMEDAVARAMARFGGIDVVMAANAGMARYGSVLAVDPAVFKRVLDINVLGVFHTARAALPAISSTAPFGEREASRHTPTLAATDGRGGRRLGRSTSARTIALADHVEQP